MGTLKRPSGLFSAAASVLNIQFYSSASVHTPVSIFVQGYGDQSRNAVIERMMVIQSLSYPFTTDRVIQPGS